MCVLTAIPSFMVTIFSYKEINNQVKLEEKAAQKSEKRKFEGHLCRFKKICGRFWGVYKEIAEGFGRCL